MDFAVFVFRIHGSRIICATAAGDDAGIEQPCFDEQLFTVLDGVQYHGLDGVKQGHVAVSQSLLQWQIIGPEGGEFPFERGLEVCTAPGGG